MPSPEKATYIQHQNARRKYVTLAWDLWREQYEVRFFIWTPIPEDLLRAEVTLFWQDQISQVHGWTNILKQIVKPITDAISGLLSWLWNNLIQPGVKLMLDLLRTAMDVGFSAVKWVLNGITSIVQGIQAGVAGLGQAIAGVGSWLASELTKATSWIWQQLQGLFSTLGEILKQIGTWIITAIKTHVVDPIIGLLTPVFEAIKGLISAVWNFITGGAVIGSPVEWRGSYVRWIGIITGVSALALGGIIGATLVDVIHPFKDTRLKDIATFAFQFTGMAFLQAAFFTTYFDIACSKPVRQELNAIFTPEIPGPGDLIRFVVREVIPPPEFHEAMGLQGFHKHWTEAYWEAHWMLPPTERTRTAFLRKQISEEEYRKFLIWYDFRPEPRPGITKSDVDLMLATQYDWPGRIETRWMLEWGQITDAEAEDLLKAAGLDPAWSPRVAKAYLLNQLRDEYNRVRTTLMTRYKEGFLKQADFENRLKTLNFATHTIAASLEWAEEAAKWDELWEQAQEWWRLAKAKKISPEKYAEEMRALGMVEERITGRMNLLRKLTEIAAVK